MSVATDDSGNELTHTLILGHTYHVAITKVKENRRYTYRMHHLFLFL